MMTIVNDIFPIWIVKRAYPKIYKKKSVTMCDNKC